ncbi:hypothetical protein ACU4GD_26350 [Cupriavidus basilensis]
MARELVCWGNAGWLSQRPDGLTTLRYRLDAVQRIAHLPRYRPDGDRTRLDEAAAASLLLGNMAPNRNVRFFME